MAQVQYTVFYRYVHQTTKKPCTNTTISKYDIENRFLKAYGVEGIKSDDILAEQSPENPKYDMLFIYNGVFEINPFLEALPATNHVVIEKFERCKGEGWFVASRHASLQSALNASDPLVRTLGKDNVLVVKNVPLDITVGLE